MNVTKAAVVLLCGSMFGCDDANRIHPPSETQGSIIKVAPLSVSEEMKVITQDGMNVIYWPHRVMIVPEGKYTSITTFVDVDSDGNEKEWVKHNHESGRLSFGNHALFYEAENEEGKPYKVSTPIDYQGFTGALRNGEDVKTALKKSTKSEITLPWIHSSEQED